MEKISPKSKIRTFFRKNFCAVFLLVSILFPFPFIKTSAENENSNATVTNVRLRTVAAHETVEHLFTHCLIAHPDIAFAEGNDYGQHLDRDCLTPAEFKKILLALYKGGYALVNAYSTFRIENDTAWRIPFEFPADKKPLILSFDDTVYAQKNLGKGMCDKLIIDKNGKIAGYTKNAKSQIHKDEFIPILENFIAEYPDFSYKNARGILFLTGFDGILGYRTQRSSPNRKTETEKVKPIIKVLKENGWLFGCHSYAHGHMRNYTAEQMASDIEKWKNEVQILVGETQLYAYPYGEWVLGDLCDDPRQQVLTDAGFRLFCGVGEAPFYTKMPLGRTVDTHRTQILFQDRCPLDGVSLRKNNCKRLFEASAVYDHRRPIPFS